jgi:hypothetical protein
MGDLVYIIEGRGGRSQTAPEGRRRDNKKETRRTGDAGRRIKEEALRVLGRGIPKPRKRRNGAAAEQRHGRTLFERRLTFVENCSRIYKVRIVR